MVGHENEYKIIKTNSPKKVVVVGGGPGGMEAIQESLEIAKILEYAGVDAFNVSPGWHESKIPIMLMAIPRMAYVF